jgi:hypothetical protein
MVNWADTAADVTGQQPQARQTGGHGHAHQGLREPSLGLPYGQDQQGENRQDKRDDQGTALALQDIP